MTVLIPLGGSSVFFPKEEFHYPRPLIEIRGEPVIKRVVANLRSLGPDLSFTFVINLSDQRDFHLDRVLRLVAGDQTNIVALDGHAQGAACSCLMAIEAVDPRQALVIANSDQILDIDLSEAIRFFRERDADAGVVVFEAVHPRWSFARIVDELVVETDEKRPISSNAIAGLYYFREAADFFDAAMLSIKRNAAVEGKFYVAPVLNELILKGRTVRAFSVDREKYHSFYTPQKLTEYEAFLVEQSRKGAGGSL